VTEKRRSAKTASWAQLFLGAKNVLVKPRAANETNFTLPAIILLALYDRASYARVSIINLSLSAA